MPRLVARSSSDAGDSTITKNPPVIPTSYLVPSFVRCFPDHESSQYEAIHEAIYYEARQGRSLAALLDLAHCIC